MRGFGIWGKRKRTTRGFRFTSYLHRGCIMVVELIHGWQTEAQCESNWWWFRAWGSLKFGEKERGRRDGSVLSFTCIGDSSWRPESHGREDADEQTSSGEMSLVQMSWGAMEFDARSSWCQTNRPPLCSGSQSSRIVLYNGWVPRRFAWEHEKNP